MKRTLDVMVVPVGREPEFKTLEADENGSFLKALQGCVGGLIEPLPGSSTTRPRATATRRGRSARPSSTPTVRSTPQRPWRTPGS